MAESSHRIRRAEPGEAGELADLQERSSSHWRYPPGYFDWAGDEARVIPETYVRDNPVFVLEGDDGRLGFYAFIEQDDDELLLDKLFVDADQIGKGYGRLLWQHAVGTARELGRSEFVIGSDPNAAPFYAAMGAVWYASKPTDEPTWTVQMYRYVIPR
ncbi:MAG TPA: GNAT family N-acetyltransferase [Streptosporangiales bacterium]